MGVTDKQRLIQDRLGVSLTKYLQQCRRGGLSLRSISKQIEAETGVSVSKSSLAEWLG